MTNMQNWHDYPGDPKKWKELFKVTYREHWNVEYDESVLLRNDAPHDQTFTVWLGPAKDPEHPPVGWQRQHMSVRCTVPSGGELEVPRAWLAAVHKLDGSGRIVGGHAPTLRVVQRSEDGREQDVTPPLDGALAHAMKPVEPGKKRRVRS